MKNSGDKRMMRQNEENEIIDDPCGDLDGGSDEMAE